MPGFFNLIHPWQYTKYRRCPGITSLPGQYLTQAGIIPLGFEVANDYKWHNFAAHFAL